MYYAQDMNSKLGILKEFASTITSTDNLDSITNLVLELALSYTKARHISIMLMDDKGNLVVRAAKGIDTDIIPMIRVSTGEGICGKVAKDKNPLLVKDINNDERVNNIGSGKYETNSFICCPIMKKETILGIINIADKSDGESFTEDDLELIEILANQTAISLGYSHLSSLVRSMTLELDERNKVLIDSDRLKSEFVAVMSHEFRNPLNSIAGAAYYLQDNNVPLKQKNDFINMISAETDKLIGLLDGILDFSLLEKEEPIIKKKILNVKDICKELITSKTVKDILAKNNISIKTSCPEPLPYIVGEKVRLIQVFIHLIDGISKYTSAGDSVDLTAAARNSSVHISIFIKDRSIPEAELPLFFDTRSPWTDLSEIKNKLKFYLAKKIIELHKGSISVSNAPEGISIQMIFPMLIEEHDEARINELCNILLQFTAETMNLNKCSIMLKDEMTGELVIRSAIGFDEDIIRRTRVRSGDNIAGHVAAENMPLFIEDIEHHPDFCKKSSLQYTTKSLLSIPIVLDGNVIGVLNLNNKASGLPFEKKDLYFALALTERLSHIIEKVQRDDVSNSEFKKVVSYLEKLLYAEQQHRKKNGELSSIIMKLMNYMQCSEDEIKLAVYSAAFYDLGLTQIDEYILMKSGELSPVEEKIIKTHPFPSVGLIDYMETDQEVKKIILHHHERFDGLGYPDGLKADHIPFLSRILGVADAYTAMTADRPYRNAFAPKEAADRIKAGAGTQFDPYVVDAFLNII